MVEGSGAEKKPMKEAEKKQPEKWRESSRCGVLEETRGESISEERVNHPLCLKLPIGHLRQELKFTIGLSTIDVWSPEVLTRIVAILYSYMLPITF